MTQVDSIHDYRFTGSGVRLFHDEEWLEIEFVKPDVIRLLFAPRDEFCGEERTFVVDGRLERGIAVDFTAGEESLTLESEDLVLTIFLAPFSLRIGDGKRESVVELPREGGLEWENERRVLRLHLDEDEGIYGLGQGNFPSLDLRDRERRMWQEWRGNSQCGPAGIPFFMSSGGYGFLLNSSWPSRFAVGRAKPEPPPDPEHAAELAPPPWPPGESCGENDPDNIAIILDSNRLDCFFIVGDDFFDILAGYRELTGTTPMLPRWSLGYIQSKNRYRSCEEILEVAREYRRRGIPGDAMVIDWLWFREFGDLSWDREKWTDVRGMAEELDSMGFRLVQAQHPFIDRSSQNWDYFRERNVLVEYSPEWDNAPDQPSALYDFSSPNAARHWWSKIEKLYEVGVDGYWTDMGEPAAHPEGCEHHLGPRERVHNIYSLLWASALYSGQRSHTDRRVLSLHRTAYAGIQRYGAALWSGDISCTWEVLKNQVVLGQQVCLSGLPYWGTDIGGFIPTDFYEPELYVRWLEWGIWCPLFRTHGTRPANEPWSFGSGAERAIRKSIELRYALLPYIYSLSRRVHETGVPMMRAMVMCYPDDGRAVKSELQFMFGPDFLVAPVVERGARSRAVYLPRGEWYDFWTDELISGPRKIEAFSPLDRIPVYVRAGSIIPRSIGRRNARGADHTLRIDVYPGADAEFELYEDDGETYGYEEGEFAETRIRYLDEINSLVIHGAVGTYPGQPRMRGYRVVFHDQALPEHVIVNGERLGVFCPGGESWKEDQVGATYDPETGLLTLNLSPYPVEERVAVQIRPLEAQEASDQGVGRVTENDLHLDFSRPDGRTAEVYAHLEGGEVPDPLRWNIEPLTGWKCVEEIEGTNPGNVVASAGWRLEAEGDRFHPQSRVVVTADCGGGRQLSAEVHLHSECNTVWNLLAPLSGDGGEAFDRRIPLEDEGYPRDFDRVYRGIDGQEVAWSTSEGLDCLGYVDLREYLGAGFLNMGEPRYLLAYTAARVWCPGERMAHIELLGEDRFKVWFNGEQILRCSVPPSFSAARAAVRMRKGWNTVLIKNTKDATREWGGRAWGFYFRLLDRRGEIMEDILYSL